MVNVPERNEVGRKFGDGDNVASQQITIKIKIVECVLGVDSVAFGLLRMKVFQIEIGRQEQEEKG